MPSLGASAYPLTGPTWRQTQVTPLLPAVTAVDTLNENPLIGAMLDGREMPSALALELAKVTVWIVLVSPVTACGDGYAKLGSS